MAYLFKHAALGSIIRYCRTGNISFSREKGKEVLTSSSALEDFVGTGIPVEGKIPANHFVTWSGPDDPSNPLNWPRWQRILVTFILCFWTFAVYVGSSIYTSSQESVVEVFGVSHTQGALGLSLYVLGYGLGSLLFSPLSEIPAIGRNPPYFISGILFVILCIPTSLVNNFPGLMVLRFLLGFMCSPSLSTTGASLGDIWAPEQFPYAIALFSLVATMGPTCGPTISSFAVKALGWHFSSWELLIISGFIFSLLALLVPETSRQTILYYKAKRMREETGDQALMSEAELKQKELDVRSMLWNSLIKPWEMNLKDPALFFTTMYLGLAYGVFYMFFESFPYVYPVYYSFNSQSVGLVFLAAVPPCAIAFVIQYAFLRYKAMPGLATGTFGELENFLIPGVLACPFIPAGLFIYAWTARASTHWMAPTMGLAMVIFGIYSIAQCIFLYIPNIYPKYAASIFAANGLARSLFAVVAVLVAKPMFDGIGVSGGVSILGGLMVVGMVGMWTLYRYGKVLRSRTKFAVA